MQLTADRRRIGILAACVMVGLLLWARIIIVSNMPRTAVANESASSNGSAKNENPSLPAPGDQEGHAPRATQTVELSAAPGRDPFVISTQYFPKATPVTALDPDPNKSGSDQAEDAEQIEARKVAHLQALISKLRLEAAMGSDIAVISGKSYRRGDEIAGSDGERIGLVLAEVKQRSVILDCEGRRFELKMASPRLP